MSKKSHFIEKPPSVRVSELLAGLLVLRDALDGLNAGRGHQILPLAGQIRALLADRSKKNPPLLPDLYRTFGKNLQFFAEPSGLPKDPAKVRDAMLYFFAGLPIGIHQTTERQRAMTLKELLSLNVLWHEKTQYSLSEIIDFFANKAGGAHYARKWPAHLSMLAVSGPVQPSPVTSAIVQLGQATLEAGVALLKEIIEFDLHLLVYIPAQEQKELRTIADAQHAHVPMGWTVSRNPLGRVQFEVRALDGRGARITAQRQIDWSDARHLMFGMRVGYDLHTTLLISVDGDAAEEMRVPAPLFVVAEAVHYDLYVNRSATADKAGLAMGLGVILMMRAKQDRLARAEVIVDLAHRRSEQDDRYVEFSPSEFARAEPGGLELEFQGGKPVSLGELRGRLNGDPGVPDDDGA